MIAGLLGQVCNEVDEIRKYASKLVQSFSAHVRGDSMMPWGCGTVGNTISQPAIRETRGTGYTT